MIDRFGSGEDGAFRQRMNWITGTAVWLAVFGLAVRMVIAAGRRQRAEEKEDAGDGRKT